MAAPATTQFTMTRAQAATVESSAPTAIPQKSFGVPSQVRGVRPAAGGGVDTAVDTSTYPPVTTIQEQRESCSPEASITRLPSSWEMRTMKTQQPPYSVRAMATSEVTRPHRPTARSPMAG